MKAAARDQVTALGTMRIAGRVAVMAAWFMLSVMCFYLWRFTRFATPAGASNPWPPRFLGGIARIAGVRIRIVGQPAPGRLLLLANHVSWIDVPALAATTGAAFVAHDGLASVALLKWLCDMNDTIFVARHDRTSIGAQIDAVRTALAGKSAITIFPEGTTSDGTALLPFKSALLAALDPLPPQITVQPAWLDYGPRPATIAWVGQEAGIGNFKRILARADPLELTVHFLAPLSAAQLANRKVMATAAHQAITRAMTPLQKPAGLA